MAVDTVNSAAQTQTQADKARTTLAGNLNSFLTLLTTQLANQDPLAPMDSTQFTNQLVQFSSVEQAINSNDKLQKLIDLQTSNGGAAVRDALNYIGLTVEAKGSEFSFDGTNKTSLAFNLPQATASTLLSIYDEDNNLVTSFKSPTTEGRHTLDWDGKNDQGDLVEAGKYTFKVTALDSEAQAVTGIDTYMNGMITGVEQGTDGVLLKMDDRTISISDVVSARYTPMTD